MLAHVEEIGLMPPAHLKATSSGADGGRVRGCTGKRGYGTKREAKGAGDRLGVSQTQYQCTHCNWWHNTGWSHWDKPRKRQISARLMEP